MTPYLATQTMKMSHSRVRTPELAEHLGLSCLTSLVPAAPSANSKSKAGELLKVAGSPQSILVFPLRVSLSSQGSDIAGLHKRQLAVQTEQGLWGSQTTDPSVWEGRNGAWFFELLR